MRTSVIKCIVPLVVLSVTVAARSDATFRPHSALTNPSFTSSAHLEKSGAKSAASIVRSTRGGGAANSLPQALLGTVVFAAIEKAVKMGLKAADIKYPAQLGACIILFIVMSITDAVAPVAANKLYTALAPAAALLAKWFPVFFVPGLALLPLSPPIGGTMDVSSTSLILISVFLMVSR